MIEPTCRDYERHLEDIILSRRQFLNRFGMGFGAFSLTSLIGMGLLPSLDAEAADSFSPLAPKQPQFPPKAKRVLHIFASGAPSHIDTWDPKPELDKLNDKNLPGDNGGVAFASPFKFKKSGKSGIEVSEVFPLIGEHIDDIAVIRSMHADVPNHEPSLLLMNCGEARLIRPSMGSWLVYGLGTENQNLPGFVVLWPGFPVVGP